MLNRYALWPKVWEHQTITRNCDSSPKCYQEDGRTQLYRMSLNAVALEFPCTGTKRPKNLLQNDNAPVH